MEILSITKLGNGKQATQSDLIPGKLPLQLERTKRLHEERTEKKNYFNIGIKKTSSLTCFHTNEKKRKGQTIVLHYWILAFAFTINGKENIYKNQFLHSLFKTISTMGNRWSKQAFVLSSSLNCAWSNGHWNKNQRGLNSGEYLPEITLQFVVNTLS
jgi:hypothetical protein